MDLQKILELGSAPNTLPVKKNLNGNETLTNKKTDSSTNKQISKTTNNQEATQSSNNGSRNLSGNLSGNSIHLGPRYERNIYNNYHVHPREGNPDPGKQSKEIVQSKQGEKAPQGYVLDARKTLAIGMAVGALGILALNSARGPQRCKDTSSGLSKLLI